ncbi:two-component sensor histidine kinase [Pseudorhizobium halotolerans]|uniref:histidine kinase n=1 Tax=Pseudorhizobium halotolerans TaxID=1233081 RepID=A0ABM8PXH8_9HYPH|nr:hybrid sensor histidine kinase/response regulator [Pseudorhizobium halotolerans]CAD7053750.1 two-component sensor histidine kinase [Pseudorhizobium halotolerans]
MPSSSEPGQLPKAGAPRSSTAQSLRRSQAALPRLYEELLHPAFLTITLVLLLSAAVLAFVLRASFVRTLDAGAERASTLSRLLQEQTAGSIQSIDLVLQSMVDAVSTFRIPEHDAEFQRLLDKRLRVLPHVRALYVIGADGFITHDTDHPATPRVTLADRDYFRFHRSYSADALHISEPLISRSTQRWFVSVSRRIGRSDGGFGGIAVAALEPAFFDRLFSELSLSENDAINFLHADGTLIARSPTGQEFVGQNFATSRLFTELLPQERSGSYSVVSEADGVERIVSYRRVAGYPLVVTVALSRSDLLANWKTVAIATTTGFLLLTALVLLVTLRTIRNRREQRLAHERALTTQKLEMLGQMTGGIAHDFNNVVAVALAGLTMIRKHLDNPSRAGPLLDETEKAVHRGADIAARLLTFARHRELVVQPGDLNAQIRSLEPMLKQAAGSSVSLELELAEDVPECLLDNVQFDAALLNLVINARDAMPQGGSITICTRSHPTTDKPQQSSTSFACVQVRDTGSGMTPEDMQRAFEPLFSTKGEKGTGLGLSQVQFFMHQIGGQARLSSELGKGTTVELLFPCVS